jgi:DNA-directed RNA polymerase subunit RPC12/RpoP
MQGRYGNDQLNKFLMVVMFLFLLLSFLAGNVFYMIGLGLLLYIYYRMFSRNIYKRAAENQAYLKVRNRVTGFFKAKFSFLNGDKTHRVFICPNCKQKIRIPKGKGKIAIRCPKCSNEFVKRT